MSDQSNSLHTTIEPSLGAVLGRVHRQWRSAVNLAVAPLGMTESRWTALMLLKKTGEGCTQQTLASKLSIEMSSLSRTLNQLQQQGLIERRTDPEDKRVHCLWLTPEGAEMVEALAVRIGTIRDEIYAGISEAELDAFASVLVKMEANAVACATHQEKR